jgi:protein arginine kinase activator
MRCQFCSNPATICLVDVVDRRKREMRLCEACADQHHLFEEPKQELNVPAVLQLLMGAAADSAAAAAAELTCPHCGLEYREFRATGRLGCPDEYAAFAEPLRPLLERIHRRLRHVGKAPRGRRSQAAAAEREELQRQLRAAVAAERYEDAARLRDLIRRKDATDEPGQSAAEPR